MNSLFLSFLIAILQMLVCLDEAPCASLEALSHTSSIRPFEVRENSLWISDYLDLHEMRSYYTALSRHQMHPQDIVVCRYRGLATRCRRLPEGIKGRDGVTNYRSGMMILETAIPLFNYKVFGQKNETEMKEIIIKAEHDADLQQNYLSKYDPYLGAFVNVKAKVADVPLGEEVYRFWEGISGKVVSGCREHCQVVLKLLPPQTVRKHSEEIYFCSVDMISRHQPSLPYDCEFLGFKESKQAYIFSSITPILSHNGGNDYPDLNCSFSVPRVEQAVEQLAATYEKKFAAPRTSKLSSNNTNREVFYLEKKFGTSSIINGRPFEKLEIKFELNRFSGNPLLSVSLRGATADLNIESELRDMTTTEEKAYEDALTDAAKTVQGVSCQIE